MPAADILIKGAREHNLRNVDVVLPRNQLICLTGVSGSGKSSLAFDTVFAEGQRRYVESLSTFARQFLGQMPKPDVDLISGLSPAISISQKSTGTNPRSTVGTVTEIYDYLRILFARVGQGHCPKCGVAIASQTREQIIVRILELAEGTKFSVLAPIIRRQKGEYRDLFADLLKQGFVRARVDGQTVSLHDNLKLDRQMRHDIEVVVDRLEIKANVRPRLAEAVELAMKLGKGTLIVESATDRDDEQAKRGGNRRRQLQVVKAEAELVDQDDETSAAEPIDIMRGASSGRSAKGANDVVFSVDYSCVQPLESSAAFRRSAFASQVPESIRPRSDIVQLRSANS